MPGRAARAVAAALCALSAARGEGDGYYCSQKNCNARRTGYSTEVFKGDVTSEPTYFLKSEWELFRANPLIDDKLNVYQATSSGSIFKFNKDGKRLWRYDHPNCGEKDCTQPTVPAIMGGLLFCSNSNGDIYAVDMETGKQRWSVNMKVTVDIDSTTILASNGTLVFSTSQTRMPQPLGGGSNNKVVALNAEDGAFKWEFMCDIMTYNFMAAAPGDGTVVFSDQSGGLYRLRMDTGERIWRSGYMVRDTFSTGTMALAPEGVDMVFATSNEVPAKEAPAGGLIHAYRVSDGQLMWQQFLGHEHEANQAPAVGYLGPGKTKLSVVAAVGKNPDFMFSSFVFGGHQHFQWAHLLPNFVANLIHRANMQDNPYHWLYQRFLATELQGGLVALDAHTGEVVWMWSAPPFRGGSARGDAERFEARLGSPASMGSSICLPDSWSPPIIDGEGKVIVGDGRTGIVYQLHDRNGDGKVEGPGEVVESHGHDAWLGHLAQAPGMLVGAPCGGGLKVWKY